MSNEPLSPIHPAYIMPEPKRRSAGPIILGCLVAFVVLAALMAIGGVAVFRAASRTSAEAVPVSNQFLALVNAHKYTDAYALLTPATQASTTVDSLRDIQELLDKRHATVEPQNPAWNANTFNGVITVTLTYTNPSAGSRVRVVMQKTDKGFRVAGYNFQL